MYYIGLLLLFIIPCYALDFGIPLPNTLILAGTSSLVTWRGLGDATAVNLYLGNGVNTDQLTIIKIFGQNIASTKTSMWITIPKDTPSDNTYLVLEGNDTPPSRATVSLNIGLGSKSPPPAVPTGPSSSSSSSPPTSSSSSSPSSSSNPSSSPTPTKTNQSSTTPSGTSSGDATDTHTQPSSDGNSGNLSSGQAAGVIVGSIGAAGLALGAIFLIRRKRRLNNQKRHTELFDEKNGGYHDYDNNNYPATATALPPPSSSPIAGPTSYSRSFGHTQDSAYYPMKTIDSTNMQDNGFQSRTQLSPDLTTGGPIPFTTISKPDEATLADRHDKPHSRF